MRWFMGWNEMDIADVNSSCREWRMGFTLSVLGNRSIAAQLSALIVANIIHERDGQQVLL